MPEYDLDDGALFTKVSRYELLREKPDGRIFIDVHQVLSSEKKGKYVAIPNMILFDAKDEYTASGKTEDEALKKCLKRIKGKRTKEITKDFPKYEVKSK